MKNGLHIFARLRCTSTVPRRLAVASEVATLDLTRSHDIPVLKVLDYSTNPDDFVGSEYIIMERMPGKPIGESWYTLSDKERLKVLMELVKLEAKLFSNDLSASGGLFYSHDLPPNVERVIVHPSQDSGTTAGRGEIDLRRPSCVTEMVL